MVKITVGVNSGEKYGSGVLIRSGQSSNLAYVFTAKHNFLGGDLNLNGDGKYFHVSSIKMKAGAKAEATLNIFSSNVYFLDSIQEDFALVPVRACDYVKKLPELNIYSGEIDDLSVLSDQLFHLAGFPEQSYHGGVENYEARLFKVGEPNLNDFTIENANGNVFDFDSDRNELYGTHGLTEGFSGGGVFVERRGQPLLVGIQKEIKFQGKFIFTFLSGVRSEIESLIEYMEAVESARVGGYAPFSPPLFDDVLSVGGNDLDLSQLSFDDIEQNWIFEGKFRDVESKEFKSDLEKLKKQQRKLEGQLRSIAREYANYGVIYHRERKYISAKSVLKRAVEIDSKYEVILMEEHYRRPKFNGDREILQDLLTKKEELLSRRNLDAIEKVEISKELILGYEDLGGCEGRVLDLCRGKMDWLLSEKAKENLSPITRKKYTRFFRKSVEKALRSELNAGKIYLEEYYIKIGDLHKRQFSVLLALTYYHAAIWSLKLSGKVDLNLSSSVKRLIASISKENEAHINMGKLHACEKRGMEIALDGLGYSRGGEQWKYLKLSIDAVSERVEKCIVDINVLKQGAGLASPQLTDFQIAVEHHMAEVKGMLGNKIPEFPEAKTASSLRPTLSRLSRLTRDPTAQICFLVVIVILGLFLFNFNRINI